MPHKVIAAIAGRRRYIRSKGFFTAWRNFHPWKDRHLRARATPPTEARAGLLEPADMREGFQVQAVQVDAM
jgi:hypothetical protein